VIRRLVVLACIAALHAGAAAQIVIGEVLPTQGPPATVTRPLSEGAAAYVTALNRKGGLKGQKVEIVQKDDGFQPDRTLALMDEIARQRKPVAFINTSGAPNLTKLSESGLLKEHGIALVGPFTGSTSVRARKDPMQFFTDVGLDREAASMVRQVASVGFKRVAVLYQNDGFDKDGLSQVQRLAAELQAQLVASGGYERTGADTSAAAEQIVKARPQAVVMFATGAAAADFIRRYQEISGGTTFVVNSAVDVDLLVKSLGDKARGVGVMQLVPAMSKNHIGIVQEYKAALAAYAPQSQPNAIGLKGYIAAKTVVEALRLSGQPPSAAAVLKGLEAMHPADLGGYELNYANGRREGGSYGEVGIIGRDGRIMN
jgi:branched-chain amino acid transport system substrate-binding protein